MNDPQAEEQSSKEWLTIAEAARRLGVAERQARRWAERLPAAARRQEETAPGRSRALLHFPALQRLLTPDIDRTDDRTSDRTDDRTDRTPPPDMEPEEEEDGAAPEADPSQIGMTLALALAIQREGFERITAAQSAQIATLQDALLHERETARRWQEALTREQMLRAIPALPAPPDSPSPDPDAPPSPQNGPSPPQIKPQSQIRTFWQRLRGGGGGR